VVGAKSNVGMGGGFCGRLRKVLARGEEARVDRGIVQEHPTCNLTCSQRALHSECIRLYVLFFLVLAPLEFPRVESYDVARQCLCSILWTRHIESLIPTCIPGQRDPTFGLPRTRFD